MDTETKALFSALSIGVENRSPSESLCKQLSKNGGKSTADFLQEAKKLLSKVRESKPGRIEQKDLDKCVEICDQARKSTFDQVQAEVLLDCFREAYSLSFIMWAEAKLFQNPEVPEVAKESLRAIDLAILRGGISWTPVSKPVIELAHHIVLKNSKRKFDSEHSDAEHDEHKLWKKKLKVSSINIGLRESHESNSHHFQEGKKSKKIKEIQRISARNLTVEQFRLNNLTTSKPIIITDAMEAWPAMGANGSPRWADIEYFKWMAGDRLVPVEVYQRSDSTQTYLSDSWEQRVMKLSEYIDEYVIPEEQTEGVDDDRAELNEDRGYLAQYQLFDQIPALRKDIITPSYCSASLPSDKHDREATENMKADSKSIVVPSSVKKDYDEYIDQDGVKASAWFGPSHTVSPLHHDPYHNLLSQCVGYKYVRLYEAQYTNRVYPYPKHSPLCNNSLVNLDEFDQKEFPLIGDTPGLHCVLAPGEMLYIPRHCWHYVRSLSLSFSVSFFWGARLALER